MFFSLTVRLSFLSLQSWGVCGENSVELRHWPAEPMGSGSSVCDISSSLNSKIPAPRFDNNEQRRAACARGGFSSHSHDSKPTVTRSKDLSSSCDSKPTVTRSEGLSSSCDSKLIITSSQGLSSSLKGGSSSQPHDFKSMVIWAEGTKRGTKSPAGYSTHLS